MYDLTGKKALITGASGGIGGEIAKLLNQAGAEIAISGTRLENLNNLGFYVKPSIIFNYKIIVLFLRPPWYDLRGCRKGRFVQSDSLLPVA